MFLGIGGCVSGAVLKSMVGVWGEVGEREAAVGAGRVWGLCGRGAGELAGEEEGEGPELILLKNMFISLPLCRLPSA